MKRFRNLIRYIIIVVLDVFMMVTFHSYINFLILVGLILLPIYSLVGVRVVGEHVRVDLETPLEPMSKNEEFKVRFVIHNNSYFLILNATLFTMIENRFYQDFGEHTLNIPIRMKQDTRVEYPVVMDYCGRFVVSVSKLQLMDLLGIYTVSIPLSMEQECLIFPHGEVRRQEAGIMYQRGVTEAMESKEKGYDFSDISGIREYIPGDKLQNIHWKLSMKKDELMVKERVSVSAQQLNVLIDLVNDKQMNLENILELSDSITKAFVEMNLPFTIYYYSSNNGELKDLYIGNEVERKTCIEMILYDRGYQQFGLVEEMFGRLNVSGSYLYIGMNTNVTSGYVVEGKGNAIAQLRGEQ